MVAWMGADSDETRSASSDMPSPLQDSSGIASTEPVAQVESSIGAHNMQSGCASQALMRGVGVGGGDAERWFGTVRLMDHGTLGIRLVGKTGTRPPL